MTTHTPGPWKFRIVCEDGASAVILETEHRPIHANDPAIFAIREDWIRTFKEYSSALYRANHRLIETAPELLEALEGFLSEGGTPGEEGFERWFEARLKKARLAIHRATHPAA